MSAAVTLSQDTAEAAPVRCLNCGTLLGDRFCGECGQASHDHSRSILEFLRELAEHHMALDAKTLRTLAALLFRPGHLTRAYIEGRRVRFVSPFRIYVFCSFVFFLSLWLSGFALIQIHRDPAAGGSTIALPQHMTDEGGENDRDDDPLAGVSVEFLRPIRAGLGEPVSVTHHFDTGTPEIIERLLAGLNHALAHPRDLNPVLDEWLPRLLVLVLPFIAIWLALVGGGRGLYLVDHLAFGLHGQAFCFLVFSLAIIARLILPNAPLIGGVTLVLSLYTWISYRQVYRTGLIGSLFRIGFIGTIYASMLLTGVVGLLGFYLLSVPI